VYKQLLSARFQDLVQQPPLGFLPTTSRGGFRRGRFAESGSVERSFETHGPFEGDTETMRDIFGEVVPRDGNGGR
jgi:hypothetical protein